MNVRPRDRARWPWARCARSTGGGPFGVVGGRRPHLLRPQKRASERRQGDSKNVDRRHTIRSTWYTPHSPNGCSSRALARVKFNQAVAAP